MIQPLSNYNKELRLGTRVRNEIYKEFKTELPSNRVWFFFSSILVASAYFGEGQYDRIPSFWRFTIFCLLQL